ncbi:MAG: META domain-containing protein [Chloroflexota bacterium]
MKRVFYLLILTMLAVTIAACGEQATPTPAPTAVPTEQPTIAPPTAEPTAVPAPEFILTDVVWQWVELVSQPAGTTTVPNPENYTLIFREDGTFNGQADCNVILGTYATENGFSLMLGPSTMAFCGEESLDQQFLALLSSVAAGGPDGSGGFALETAGGAERLNFQNGGPAPAETAAVPAEVTGEATYLERIALPDDAVLTVQIQDISLADASATIIGEQSYVTDGQQVPLPFAVPYNTGDIVESNSYGLSVRMTAADGTLLFINDTIIPVITRGNPTSGIVAELVMVSEMDGGETAVIDENTIALSPDLISLDTQGLPYSWQPVYVPEKPYDASQPPDPMGLPAHIEILFGVSDPADRQPNDPVMYLIPVEAYETMWADAGSDAVTTMMDQIAMQTYLLPQPAPISGMPALPYEEVVGFNDVAVQVDRPVAPDQQTDEMATKNGYRFVGRWGQSPNPVTNQNLRYVYQGFTNDGAFLVAFFFPVSTAELANEPNQEETDALTADLEAYMAERAEMLNSLTTADWQPDLATLDALVQSLQISDSAANGLVNKTWLWTGDVVNPSTGEVTANELNEAPFSLTFNADGSYTGVADCNNIAGGVTIEGGVVGGLLFAPGISTAAFCGEESLDTLFTGLLAATQNFRVAPGGNTMELSMPAGGGDYVFVAEPPKSAVAVEAPGPVERAVGRQLQWISFADAVNGEQPIAEPGRYQLLLNEDGTANIQADCNSVIASYTAEGSSITFTLGPSTLVACPEDSLADQYLQSLTAVRILFNQDGDVFFDLEADSGTMRFADVGGGLPQDVLDTTWQWVGFSNPATGPEDIPNPENYLLQLEADGRFLIQADCNSGSGIYSVEGGSISFVLGPLTRAFCGEASLDAQFLQYLEAAVIWFTQDGDLYFDLKFDSGTMQFAPGESLVSAAAPASESSADSTEVPADAMVINVQGLANSYDWEVIPGAPAAPGSVGNPAYVAVTFNGATITDTLNANGPRIYVYPTEAYINVAGDSVAAQIDLLSELVVLGAGVTPDAATAMPLLPPPGSLMDRWVQYLKLPFTQGQGIRYVSDSPYRQALGAWANDTTGYYYQALTEDGRFYISLFWPVSTAALPNTSAEAPEDVTARAANPETNAAYQESIRAALNELAPADWAPNLSALDALAASIRFQP